MWIKYLLLIPLPDDAASSEYLMPSYFFFWAFCAALVVVPETSLAATDLMTPTATVCLMSRTAKRPSGGKSEKASTHMGLEGTRLTMAASPDLIDLGLSSTDLPENNCIFRKIFMQFWSKILATYIQSKSHLDPYT